MIPLWKPRQHALREIWFEKYRKDNVEYFWGVLSSLIFIFSLLIFDNLHSSSPSSTLSLFLSLHSPSLWWCLMIIQHSLYGESCATPPPFASTSLISHLRSPVSAFSHATSYDAKLASVELLLWVLQIFRHCPPLVGREGGSWLQGIGRQRSRDGKKLF